MTSTELLLTSRNLEVQKDGICRNMNFPLSSLLNNFPFYHSYSFDKFISDLNRLVNITSNDLERIRIATIITRRFLKQSPWIIDLCPSPDPEICAATRSLYSDPNSLFKINVFSWLPQTSNVHCHGTWSIVALLGNATTGRELNYFWNRLDNGLKPGHAVIKPVSKKILEAGDIIGFTSDAIHNIKSLPPKNIEGEQFSKPTLMFNIFGAPNLSKRYTFNPFDNTYKNF